MGKEFSTAARVVADENEGQEPGLLEFEIHETNAEGRIVHTQECHAHKPKDGQLAVLMATTSKHSTEQETVAGIINFFVAVLDRETHSYVVNRLLDIHDDFGLDEVQDIMEWMIEEWSGRPTQSPSVSTRSRTSDGPKSKQPTPELI